MTGKKTPDDNTKKPVTRKKAPAQSRQKTAQTKKPATQAKTKKPRTYPPKKPTEPTKASQLVKTPDKPGRPTAYTEENVLAVLLHIATGNSVNSLKDEEDLVSPRTVYLWLFKHEEFMQKYLEAQKIRSLALSEEIFDIADDGQNDWMEKVDKEGENIGWVVNGENVQRSRLRAQVRQWHLERINGKIFGDKKQIDHGVQEGSPLEAMLARITGTTLRPKPQGDKA